MKLKKLKALCFCLLTIMAVAFSQGQNINENWYFGDGAGIHFNPGPNVLPFINNPSLLGSAISASLTTRDGNIIYTDGQRVYFRNSSTNVHSTINTTPFPIFNSPIATKNVFCILPGSEEKYLLFIGGLWSSDPFAKVRYVIIEKDSNNEWSLANATNNSGLNEFINGNYSVTVVAHQNPNKYWVVTHQPYSSLGNAQPQEGFNSYLVDDQGLNTTPVISGTTINTTSANEVYTNYASLVSSKHGNRIATLNSNTGLQGHIYSFNNSTGTVGNTRAVLPLNVRNGAFSSDGNYFYFIHQDVLKRFNTTNINSPINEGIVNNFNFVDGVQADMSIALDDNIYIGHHNSLTAINDPGNTNISSISVNINSINPEGTFGGIGLNLHQVFLPRWIPESSGYEENPCDDCDFVENAATSLLTTLTSNTENCLQYTIGAGFEGPQCLYQSLLINWGDGNVEYYNDATITHTYAQEGTYIPIIIGYNAEGNRCDSVSNGTIEVDCCDCEVTPAQILTNRPTDCTTIFNVGFNGDECLEINRVTWFVNNNIVQTGLSQILEHTFSSVGPHNISVQIDYKAEDDSCKGKVISEIDYRSVFCRQRCGRACDENYATSLVDELINTTAQSNCSVTIKSPELKRCYSIYIHWGDGTVELLPSSSELTHSYPDVYALQAPDITYEVRFDDMHCFEKEVTTYLNCGERIMDTPQTALQTFRLYPNPSNGTFKVENLSAETILNIEVKDIFGKSIKHLSRNFNENIRVNTTGIYFVHVIYANGNQAIKKLIVK